jgi:hypothetical protein
MSARRVKARTMVLSTGKTQTCILLNADNQSRKEKPYANTYNHQGSGR